MTKLTQKILLNNNDDDDGDEEFLNYIESNKGTKIMPLLLNTDVSKDFNNNRDDDFLSYIEKRIDMSIGLIHSKDSLFVDVRKNNTKNSGCVIKEILSDDDDEINSLNIIEKEDSSSCVKEVGLNATGRVKDDGSNTTSNIGLEINGKNRDALQVFDNVVVDSNYKKSEESVVCDKEIEDIFASCFDETSSSTSSISSIGSIGTT